MTDTPKRAKKDKADKERKVYEAGGVIVCDGKVVLRLTDEQHWISPRGKLKKHETPSDAAVHEAVEELREAGTSRAAVTAGGVAMRYVPDPPSPEPGPPEPAPQPPSPEPPDPIEVTSS